MLLELLYWLMLLLLKSWSVPAGKGQPKLIVRPGEVYIQQVWHSAKFRCRCLISIYPISPQSLNSVSRDLCDYMFTCRLQRSSCGLGCRPFVGILASCEFFFRNHVLSQQGANGSLAPLEISLTNRSLAN